jgi:hypothetical protein
MKNRFLTVLLSATVILLTSSINVSAQFGNKDDWKERMQSEKIAFLTMEIGLTPDEAQKFWPIYNMVSDDMDKAMHEVFSSYMELEKALNEEKSDKEISKYLERYLDALEKQNEIRDDSVEEYRKILTDKKVAKIFVAEEKFRRQHIRRLHERPGEKK